MKRRAARGTTEEGGRERTWREEPRRTRGDRGAESAWPANAATQRHGPRPLFFSFARFVP